MNYPNKIFIELYPTTKQGYIYTKDFEHDGGGCYYSCNENPSPVTGSFISLYPDGRLTCLWNGKESTLNHNWTKVIEKEA